MLYAKYLGIDLPQDQQLLYIAVEGLKAKIPYPWKACKTAEDELYFFNFEDDTSLWEHPYDQYFKKIVQFQKEEFRNYTSKNTTLPKIEVLSLVQSFMVLITQEIDKNYKTKKLDYERQINLKSEKLIEKKLKNENYTENKSIKEASFKQKIDTEKEKLKKSYVSRLEEMSSMITEAQNSIKIEELGKSFEEELILCREKCINRNKSEIQKFRSQMEAKRKRKDVLNISIQTDEMESMDRNIHVYKNDNEFHYKKNSIDLEFMKAKSNIEKKYYKDVQNYKDILYNQKNEYKEKILKSNQPDEDSMEILQDLNNQIQIKVKDSMDLEDNLFRKSLLILKLLCYENLNLENETASLKERRDTLNSKESIDLPNKKLKNLLGTNIGPDAENKLMQSIEKVRNKFNRKKNEYERIKSMKIQPEEKEETITDTRNYSFIDDFDNVAHQLNDLKHILLEKETKKYQKEEIKKSQVLKYASTTEPIHHSKIIKFIINEKNKIQDMKSKLEENIKTLNKINSEVEYKYQEYQKEAYKGTLHPNAKSALEKIKSKMNYQKELISCTLTNLRFNLIREKEFSIEKMENHLSEIEKIATIDASNHHLNSLIEEYRKKFILTEDQENTNKINLAFEVS